MKPTQSFENIVNKRRATILFSENAPFDHDAVTRSLKLAILAPTSNNMQLWEAYRVTTPEKRSELAKICLNQKPATSARELIIFVCRNDLWRQRSEFNYKEIYNHAPQHEELSYYKKTIPLIYNSGPFGLWGTFKGLAQLFSSLFHPSFLEVRSRDLQISAHKSCALPAQTFMLGISAEGYDSCPMEGYDSRRLRHFLNLPRKAQPSLVIAVGPARKEVELLPRIRVPYSSICKEI